MKKLMLLTLSGLFLLTALASHAEVTQTPVITGASTKTVELLEEESIQMNRFVKSLKRNVSEAITREDEMLVLPQELDNGNLCAHYPKLWSHSKIKTHMTKELEVRFKQQL